MANISNAIPSLSSDGFITNKNLQMTKLFGYFMAADYSQSTFFKHRVMSLKYVLAQYPKPADAALGIKTALTTLYSKYYDKVTVYVEQEDNGGGIVKLHIDIQCIDREPYKEYNLYKEIKTKDGNMVEYENSLDKLYNYYMGVQ